jgi:hypothetical protein
MRTLKAAVLGVALAAFMALPVSASNFSPSQMPAPGTLNYVEGQASIGGESLSSKSVGSAELQPGQTLSSGQGKAEILLTPGVFLRVGSDSAVKMISPSLTNTEIEVQRGEALIEVDQIFKQNNLRVLEDGATTQLQKRGLYDFNADQQVVRVLDGQALLQAGDQNIKIKGDHEVTLNAPELKSRKFDKKTFEADDPLYAWSSLRSQYVAEANAQQAPTYILNGGGGPWWWGPGWYWNPAFGFYTFIPGSGMLYSPFGWGFYSPYWAPVYYGPWAYGPHVVGRPWGPPRGAGVGPHGWGPPAARGFGGERAVGGFGGAHAGGPGRG